MRLIYFVVAVLVATPCFSSDILTLNNDMVFEGKVKKITKNCVVVFKAQGKRYLVPADEIYSIEFEDVNDKIYTDFLQLNDSDKCLKGSNDADAFHGKKGGHFVLGFLFGPFSMIGTAIANPNPMNGARTGQMSKNQNLFDDPNYLKCYKKKAKGQLIGMEALGWGSWILIALLFL